MVTISSNFGSNITNVGATSIPGFGQYNIRLGVPPRGCGVFHDPNDQTNGVLGSLIYSTGLASGAGVLYSSGSGNSGILLINDTELPVFSSYGNECIKLSLDIFIPKANEMTSDNVCNVSMGNSGLIGFILVDNITLKGTLIVLNRETNLDCRIYLIDIDFDLFGASNPSYTYIARSTTFSYVHGGTLTAYVAKGLIQIYYEESLIYTFKYYDTNLTLISNNIKNGIFIEESLSGWLMCDNYLATNEENFPALTEYLVGEIPIDNVPEETAANDLGFFTSTSPYSGGHLVTNGTVSPTLSNKNITIGTVLFSMSRVPFKYKYRMYSQFNVYLDPLETALEHPSIGIACLCPEDLSTNLIVWFYYDNLASVGQKIKCEVLYKTPSLSLYEHLPLISMDETTWNSYNGKIWQAFKVICERVYTSGVNKVMVKIGVGNDSDPENSPDHTVLTDALPPDYEFGEYAGYACITVENALTIMIEPRTASSYWSSASATNPKKPSIGSLLVDSVNISIGSTEFDDNDLGGSHESTQWQVSSITDTTFSSPLIDTTTSTDLIFLDVSSLNKQNFYRARVRHKDESGNWSEWSDSLGFIISDIIITPDTGILYWPSTTLLPPPSDSSSEKLQWRTKITPFFETESRQKVWSNYRVLWSLTWKVLTEKQFNNLKEFFNQCSGQFKPFYFKNPLTDEVRIMRFASDVLERELFNARLSNVKIDLIEVPTAGSLIE